jgi:competence protein ComEA
VAFLLLDSRKPQEFAYISPTISPIQAGVAETIQADTRIDINIATLAELDSLPGIGEEKAQAIVDFRENNGKFVSIEDLLYVPGIGQSLFDQIKDKIVVK